MIEARCGFIIVIVNACRYIYFIYPFTSEALFVFLQDLFQGGVLTSPRSSLLWIHKS